MLLFGVLFSAALASSFGARILAIVPAPSYSHQVVFQPLWAELSLRGHQLTLVTTHPMHNKSLTNLTEIDLSFSYELWKTINMLEMSQKGILTMLVQGVELIRNLTEAQLESPEIQKLINDENEHFDLLLVHGIIPVWFAFAEKFQCPYIILFPLDAPSNIYYTIGNPSHPVINPDFMVPYSGKLTFFQRLQSVGFTLFSKIASDWLIAVMYQKVIQKHFGNDYPPLYDILQNVSLVFVNSDPVFHEVRPLLPSVVLIGGGTHIKPPKPLPKDLQKQLDGASQGFIYFSLGSNVKSKDLSVEARHVILEAFAELPYLIMWKFELEDLAGKPDNVIISKWFPQQDILRHPNIKLFITQGGLQSMEEAIYSHVPLVGMPFIADQPKNVQKIVAKGLGKSVDYKTLHKATLKETILEVINDSRYRNRVTELAQLARDEPTTGLERAIWWTEYVLRHKGAAHLRSPAIDLPTYQYFLLDVIGFCLLAIVIVVFTTVKLLKLVFRLVKFLGCFRSGRKTKQE